MYTPHDHYVVFDSIKIRAQKLHTFFKLYYKTKFQDPALCTTVTPSSYYWWLVAWWLYQITWKSISGLKSYKWKDNHTNMTT